MAKRLKTFMAFLEGGLGETALWPPKNGFPQKSPLFYVSITSSTGQWSEPKISGWMQAEIRRGVRAWDTMK